MSASIWGSVRDSGFVIQLYGITGAVHDGVTSDQEAIRDAVADAYAQGHFLYWEAGTYVSTGNIPHFHEVRHWGPGVIKRGSDLFHVEPHEGDTNTLYVSETGASSNDGLSASQPMAMCQDAFDAFKNYGPVLDGTWIVQLAAGSWSGAGASNQLHTVPSRNRVQIKGPAQGHPNVPTAVFDGTGGAAYVHGIRISGSGVQALVQDILFQDYTTGNSRIGVVGENGADLYTNNVHADTCDWCGIYAFGTIHFRAAGGIINGCRSGIIVNDSGVYTIGYGASSTAAGCVVTNSTQSGVYISRGSQGHVDYCKIEDNPVGIDVDTGGRSHTVGNNFKRNTIGIRVQGPGAVTETTNEFNRGTADANTTNFQRNAYALEADEVRFMYSEVLFSTERTTTQHTGATGDTQVITCDDIPAYRLENTISFVKVKVYGRFVAATAGTTITVKFDGNGNALTIVGGPLTNASFELECQVREASGGTFRQYATLNISAAGVRVSNAAITFDTTQAITPSVWVNLANAADNVYIDRVDTYITG